MPDVLFDFLIGEVRSAYGKQRRGIRMVGVCASIYAVSQHVGHLDD